jgi:hypothetical protein
LVAVEYHQEPITMAEFSFPTKGVALEEPNKDRSRAPVPMVLPPTLLIVPAYPSRSEDIHPVPIGAAVAVRTGKMTAIAATACLNLNISNP